MKAKNYYDVYAEDGTLVAACLTATQCLNLEGIRTNRLMNVINSARRHTDTLFDDGKYVRLQGDSTPRQVRRVCGRMNPRAVVLVKDGKVVARYGTMSEAASHTTMAVSSVMRFLEEKIDGWLPDGYVMRFAGEEGMEGVQRGEIDKQGKPLRMSGLTLGETEYEARQNMHVSNSIYRRGVCVYVGGEMVKHYGNLEKFIKTAKRLREIGAKDIRAMMLAHVDGWHYADTIVRFVGDEELGGTQCGEALRCKVKYADRFRSGVEKFGEGMDDSKELGDTEAEIESLMQRWRDGEITTAERNERLGWLQNHAEVLRRKKSGSGRKEGIEECHLAAKYDPFY